MVLVDTSVVFPLVVWAVDVDIAAGSVVTVSVVCSSAVIDEVHIVSVYALKVFVLLTHLLDQLLFYIVTNHPLGNAYIFNL